MQRHRNLSVTVIPGARRQQGQSRQGRSIRRARRLRFRLRANGGSLSVSFGRISHKPGCVGKCFLPKWYFDGIEINDPFAPAPEFRNCRGGRPSCWGERAGGFWLSIIGKLPFQPWELPTRSRGRSNGTLIALNFVHSLRINRSEQRNQTYG